MPPGEDRVERAERILDAAAELLLRVGYRRTTVEDVAERAGVGKGTLYLHWKTREALFLAVLLRESLAAMDNLLAGLAADPRLARPSLLLEFQYRNVLARPLLRATRTGDAELLGATPPSVLVGAVSPQTMRVTGEHADGVITAWAGPRAVGEFVVPTLRDARPLRDVPHRA